MARTSGVVTAKSTVAFSARTFAVVQAAHQVDDDVAIEIAKRVDLLHGRIDRDIEGLFAASDAAIKPSPFA